MDSVLITGCRGFLGRHIIDCYRRHYWRIIGIDRHIPKHFDEPSQTKEEIYLHSHIESPYFFSEIVKEHQPKICIHLAGPASVELSFTNPAADFLAHTTPLINVLEGIRISEISTRLLLISSAAVYGNPLYLPINEDHPVNPISPYGYHKLFQENILKEYNKLFDIRVCSVRLFSTFGPGLKQLAVWDITKRALTDNFTVFGSGEETRDYLFAPDVANAVFLIGAKSKFKNEIINIASGEEIQIRTLASTIFSLLNKKGKPKFMGSCHKGNPIRWRGDVTKLKAFNFRPKFSLETGLRKTLNWIIHNA